MTTNSSFPLGFRNASDSGKVHGYSTHRLAYVKTKCKRSLKKVLREYWKYFGMYLSIQILPAIRQAVFEVLEHFFTVAHVVVFGVHAQ